MNQRKYPSIISSFGGSALHLRAEKYGNTLRKRADAAQEGAIRPSSGMRSAPRAACRRCSFDPLNSRRRVGYQKDDRRTEHPHHHPRRARTAREPASFLCATGRPDWNIDHRFQGGTDIPLNDTGRDQVRTAIDVPKQARDEGTVVDLVLSSPLSRAAESAEIVAEGLNVPYRGCRGRVPGAPFGELEGQSPLASWCSPPANPVRSTAWNPRRNSSPAAWRPWNRVRREYDGKTVLVATHGMFIALMMNALLGERPDCLTEEGFYPIPVNASPDRGALQYLDSTIDRLLVRQNEPDLGPEPRPPAPRTPPSP